MDTKTKLAHLEGHVRELRITARTHRRQLNQVAGHMASGAEIILDLLTKVEELTALAETQARLVAELADRVARIERGEWEDQAPGEPEGDRLIGQDADADRLASQAADHYAACQTCQAADHYAACQTCQNGEACPVGDPIFAALHKACGYKS